MADILFDIGVTGVKDLKEAADSMARLGTVSSKLAAAYSPLGTQTVKVVKEQNRLKKVAKELQRAYNDNRISLEQYNHAIDQEINNSIQKIKTDERLIAAAKRKQQAIDTENTRIAKLTATYRKDIVAKKAYLQAQRDIRYAERQGIITQQQMQTELEKTKLEFQEFTQGLANGANQFAKYNTAVYNAQQRKKRFAQVGLQQVGYQVGDFVVQIQSGTDALVAFGQQGSQLAGIFGAKGAIIGALIAGATAIGMVYKNIEEASKASAEDIKAAFDTVPDYFENLGSSIYNSFDQSFDKIEERYGILIANIAKQNLEAIKESAIGLVAPAETAAQPGNMLTRFLSALAPGVVGSGPASQEVQTQIKQMYTQSVVAQGILNTFEQQVKEAKNLFEIEQAVLSTYDELLGISEDAAKAFKDQAKEAGIAAAIEKRKTIELERSQRVQENIMDERFKRETELFQLEVKVSKETLELTEKLAERRQREIAERFKGETQIMNQTVEMSKETLKLAENNRLARERDIDQRFKKEAELFNMEVSMSKETLALVKKNTKAREKDINDRFAGETAVMNQAVKVSNDLLKVIENNAKEAAKRVKTAFETESFFFSVRFADEAALMSQAVSPAKDAGKGARDARKAEKRLKNVQDTVDALKDQVKQENILLGLTGERLKEEEIFYKLLEANKKADIKLSEEKIRAIARQIAAQKQANEVIQKGIDFARDMSDVFSDFIMNGFRDFKSFVSEIGNMFKRLLAEMVAQALATKIFMPITAGFTGTMMGTAAGAATGNMIGAGAGGGAFLASIGSAAAGISSGFMGVMSGGGLGSSFANLGGLLSGSVGGLGAVGAAIPAVLAIAAVVGLFTKKVKELDNGLRVTVDGTDTLVETFRLLEKSRLFGLIKSKSTEFQAAGAEIADPVTEAVSEIQQQILNAADSLGIGADAFEDFVYQFELSLKGLTEQEQLQKVNEELAKMGDAFASLSGHFSNMNDLLAVAQQRYDLETRLLQLQGNSTALLTRERERERAATHELNQGILDQIYAIEDAKIAFNALATSIQSSKDRATADFNELMEHISRKISDAEALASQSQSILSMLQSASGRIGMTREAGLDYLRSLRGVSRISDEKALGEALSAIGEPSEDLYSNFVDYQREFADQSNLIHELEKTAGKQLSHDEKILKQLQDEAKAAEENYESQLAYYDQQLKNAQDQLNALLGLNESVLSVEQAILQFGEAVDKALSAAAAAKIGGGGGGGVKADFGGNIDLLDKYDAGKDFTRDGKTYDFIKLSGANQLLDAAQQLGIQTAGQSGAEIQQAISNAGNLAVNLDNATRNQQFALGGYFSGGVRMVGERGPELEMTGPSRIMSNNDTRKMLQNPDLVEAVKGMRQEIAELRNEQRQLGINNNKYTKRTYDLYRQWDTEGLPAERT